MLVLARKAEERILIGSDIEVVILEIRGNVVRIGIKAPRETSVVRSEISERALKGDMDEPPREASASVCQGLLQVKGDEKGLQLLHNFCERRKAWRTVICEPSAPASNVGTVCAMHFG